MLVHVSLVVLSAGCRDPQTSTPRYPDDVIAFEGVSVLPMTGGEDVLTDQTVLVHEGRILELVQGEVALPSTATVIDGSGRFLMPGLVDAHAHLWYEGELTLLVANGVTAARNLFGDPLQRRWRDQIARGDRFGPALVTSGPIVDGEPPLWPTSDVVTDDAAAQRVVAEQVEQGYDLIKVYNTLEREAWSAVLREAQAAGMPVAGHVPWSVGWDEVVASGQHTIEHLDGLVDLVGASPEPVFLYDVAAMSAALDNADEARLQAAAERAAEDGVVLVPTLVVVDRFGTEDEIAAWAADPAMRYVHPDIAWSWTSSALPADVVASLDRYALALQGYTRALRDAGAAVALGTDANNPWVIPGFSVHEELRLLVAAGLTPMEALRAGTITAAAAISRPDLGTIAPGQRADLLLLEADPSADVAFAGQRVGVMLGGDWYPEEELQEKLEALAAEYASRRSALPPRFPGCH